MAKKGTKRPSPSDHQDKYNKKGNKEKSENQISETKS